MTMQALNRHMLVQCVPLPEGEAIATGPGDASLVREWIATGYPLITRMRRQEDAVGYLPLGLPLPLASQKKRIALTVRPSLIKSIRPPPLLHDTIHMLAAEHQARIAKLALELMSNADSVRVFGSLAWQFLTTKTYLHPRSDIDVIVTVSSIDQLNLVLHVLHNSELSPGPRIDGEITTPRGDAVSWRELLGSSRHVLVKRRTGPCSTLRGEWLDQLGENEV